jgi:mRNA-degrading endonuclease RelE of RelBE toxin-antitoxin system
MVTGKKNNPDDDNLEKKVQILYDSTSRVDERVKIMLENQDKLDNKFEKIIDKHIELHTKIILFEDKLEKLVDNIDNILDRIYNLENGHEYLYKCKIGAESNVKNMFTLLYNGWITIYNIVLPITVGYILYAIGIQK